MKTKNKSKTEKTKKVENVQVVHAVEPTTEDKQARKQEIIDTTVKIVSGFSDMIASWKTKKIKKHKRRFLIGLFISLSIILVVFIVLISLYACNVL